MTSIAPNPNSRLEQPPQPQPLLVKELADALGVSLRFIYQMRACGFRMYSDTRSGQMATVEEARAWIKAKNFRLVKSIGEIGADTTDELPAGGMI